MKGFPTPPFGFASGGLGFKAERKREWSDSSEGSECVGGRKGGKDSEMNEGGNKNKNRGTPRERIGLAWLGLSYYFVFG